MKRIIIYRATFILLISVISMGLYLKNRNQVSLNNLVLMNIDALTTNEVPGGDNIFGGYQEIDGTCIVNVGGKRLKGIWHNCVADPDFTDCKSICVTAIGV